jgi:membrane-bound lytic murein transglycosylase D
LKKLQLFVILGVVLSLIGYGIISKLSEEFNYRYEHNSRFQIYSVEEAPEQIFFAGEPMPLNNAEVARKFQRELQIQTLYNYSRIQLLKRAQHWLPQITPILKQYGIPEDFKYLAVVESMLMNVESPKAAAGFWQIMASTGESLGLEINDEVDERYHPIKATHAACQYLKQAYRRFGDWTSVAASYNAGMAAISSAYRNQQKESYYHLQLNPQTAVYVFRVVAVKQLIEHPKEYGYKVRYADNPYNIPLRTVQVSESIDDLAAFAAGQGVSLETLKAHNAWLLKNTLTIKEPGKTYSLLIPRNPEPIAASPPPPAVPEVPVPDSLPIVVGDSVIKIPAVLR